ILQGILSGFALSLQSQPFQHFPPRPFHLASDRQAAVDAELLRFQRNFCLEPLPPDSTPFVSNTFAVPKSNGKWRVCIDCRALNVHVLAERFLVESWEQLRTLVRRHDWLTKIDLTDAYNHISVDPDFRR